MCTSVISLMQNSAQCAAQKQQNIETKYIEKNCSLFYYLNCIEFILFLDFCNNHWIVLIIINFEGMNSTAYYIRVMQASKVS